MVFVAEAPIGFVRASEAGVRLRVESNAVVRLIQRGVLEGEMRQGRWFVTVASIENLLAAKQRAGTKSHDNSTIVA